MSRSSNLKKEITKILQELVAIPSVTGDFVYQDEIVCYVKSFFNKLGLKLKETKYNDHSTLIVSKNPNKKNYKIVFLGHLDVVPGPDSVFKPEIKNGKLYGRGAADMKGSVTVMMILVKELIKISLFENDFTLILTTDEETGGEFGAKKLAKSGLKADLMIVPDGGNSELKLINATCGIIQFTAYKETQGGSTVADNENNSIEAMFDFFQKIKREIFNLKNDNNLSVNLGRISGGEAVNQVPRKCEMKVDLRYTNPEAGKKMISIIKNQAKQSKVKLVIDRSFEPIYINPKNDYLMKYKETAEKVLGKKMKCYRQNGSHDGRYFAVKGIPLIVTRPNSGGLHSNNEWVEIDSLVRIYKVLFEYLKTLAAGV